MSQIGMVVRDHRRRIAVVCLIAAFALCAGWDSKDGSPYRSVVMNEPFEVVLQANPTTGYHWVATYDKAFVRLQKQSYIRDTSAGGPTVGTGGSTKFVFVPIKVGKTSLHFKYVRPWESASAKEVAVLLAISK